MKIRQVFGDLCVSFYHIGSTSIPNMPAKPIIDIMIEVSDIATVDTFDDGMKDLGYIPKGEYGISERRFFLKGEIERTHHVHIYQSGNQEIERHLLFRDYLIAHPEDAKRYAELKMKLALKYKLDADAYCKGKDRFIENIERKARPDRGCSGHE